MGNVFSGMTLDSNIIVAYLAGDAAVVVALTEWKRGGRQLFLSTIAEAEILSFSEWTSAEQRAAQIFLEENFSSVAFDRTLAKMAADIRRKVAIKLPDAAIAATALLTNTPLLTRNERDFRKVEGVRILTI